MLPLIVAEQVRIGVSDFLSTLPFRRRPRALKA